MYMILMSTSNNGYYDSLGSSLAQTQGPENQKKQTVYQEREKAIHFRTFLLSVT